MQCISVLINYLASGITGTAAGPWAVLLSYLASLKKKKKKNDTSIKKEKPVRKQMPHSLA